MSEKVETNVQLEPPFYVSIQNDVILEYHLSKEAAELRVREEIKRDWLSIFARKKLRKLLLKKGENIALHRYSIGKLTEVREIK